MPPKSKINKTYYKDVPRDSEDPIIEDPRKEFEYYEGIPYNSSNAGTELSRLDRRRLEHRIKDFIKNKKLNKSYNKYAVATAQAEKLGHHDFREGTMGRKKRDEIAEAIEREAHKKGKKVDKKGNIKKNVGANRISSGMEEYIISWIQNHPYLEDKEFDRFLESSGFRPEQGREVLYRYINGLRKSLPAKINKFVRRKKVESLPHNQGTYAVSQAGVGARI